MNAQQSENPDPSRQRTLPDDPNRAASIDLSTASELAGESTSRDLTTPDATRLAEFPSIDRQLGKYQLLVELARGGMGIVFKARAADGNVVALKTVRRDRANNGEFFLRFMREVQTAQQLAHPNVMPILDAGEADGYPFFTMEFARHGSLREHRDRFQNDPRAAAQLVERVARGVQHAHERGVLHRDLKPGNILLGEDDQPRVSDFGLAKFVGSEGDLTRTGQLLGTPAYMAPEQATGRIHAIGPGCDIWSLGVILYELLAGRRPFREGDDVHLIHQIQNDAPTPPSKLRPNVPLALESVVFKCLQKNPEDRYASAKDLADDLDNWLNGRSMTLGKPPLLRGIVRGVVRHPWLTAACVTVIGAVIAAAIMIPRLDPERARREYEAKLAAGNAVEWVPEKGRPVASRWIVGANSSTSDVARDGPFNLSSLTVGLHELVADPGHDRFRLHGWVRQNDGPEDGRVGFYFSYCSFAVGDTTHHAAYVFGFSESKEFKQPVELTLFGFVDDPNYIDLLVRSKLRYRSLPAADPAAGGWRELDVEVRPDEVRASVDKVPLAVANKRIIDIGIRQYFKELPNVDPQPQFEPRRSLGLFVYRGSASFKSVTITPLPAQKS